MTDRDISADIERSYVLQIVALATGQPTSAAGQYVRSYTPDGHDGRGDLVLTPTKADAKRYADVTEAMEDWRRVSTTHPLRPDGKPNRPMTAFTVRAEPSA